MTSSPPQPASEAPSEQNRRSLVVPRADVAVLGAALLFLVLLFSHVLFTPTAACLGSETGDGRTQFYPWRVYGFSRLARGEMPLWNPYTFAGMPFIANLQSAMFYPTNWLCLLLPPYRAMNASVVLNLYLSLAFAYAWARLTGRTRFGALVVGATYALGAPQFLRVYEGHWVHLCAMPWIPWLMACAEALARRGGFLPVALGAAGLALQAFAGHPQYMFYGAIAAAVYFLARLAMIPEARRCLRSLAWRLAGFAAIFVLGMVLASVQMLPSLELLSVSSRGSGLSYDWIAQYSLPPESLLTLLVPWLYGLGPEVAYWGRWNAWESGVYLGVVGFALALFGLVAGEKRWRRLALGMTLLLLLFALGRYTPLLRGLVHVPGFGLFRGLSRFAAPMSLFFGLLAGVGADALFSAAAARWRAGFAALVVLAAALVAATLAAARPPNEAPAFWRRFMAANLNLRQRPAAYHDAARVRSEPFAREAYRVAWASLARSATLATLVAVVAGLWRRRGWPPARAAAAVAVLMACDFWTWGRPYLVTFDGERFAWTEGAVRFLQRQPEPFRVTTSALYGRGPLDALVYQVPCLEGVEPNVPARFRDLFWRALDLPPDTQKTSYSVSRPSAGLNLLRLLNWRFVLSPPDVPVIDIPGAHTVYRDARLRIDELPGWLPRARLVTKALLAVPADQAALAWPHEPLIVKEPRDILDHLVGLRFEEATILESDPSIFTPLNSGPGFWRSLHQTVSSWVGRPYSMATGYSVVGSDKASANPGRLRFQKYAPEHVVLHADVPGQALLVLGDIHYPGWKARVDGKPVPILRADYMLRAVPLLRGVHRVEFLYDPLSFRAGAWLSGVGWSALAAWAVLGPGRRRRARKATPP